MRIRFVIPFLVCLTLFAVNGIARVPDWFVKLKVEIKLLESGRKDFERVFGDAVVSSSYFSGSIETVTYRMPIGRMVVTYSGGDCEKYYDYKIRRGTIIEILVLLPPETRPRFKKLKVRTTGFQTTREDDGTLLQVDPFTGYSFSTQGKRLSSLLIEPPESQNSLRCMSKRIPNWFGVVPFSETRPSG